MKPAVKATLLALLAAAVVLPLQGLAQTKDQPTTEKKPAAEKKENATPKKEAAGNKSRPIPFQGKLTSVDSTAKTVAVGQRTFQITSETKLFLSDHHTPATLSAATPGEHVSGSYRKSDDGKLTAVSVYFGEKTEGKAADKQKTPTEKPKKSPAAQ